MILGAEEKIQFRITRCPRRDGWEVIGEFNGVRAEGMAYEESHIRRVQGEVAQLLMPADSMEALQQENAILKRKLNEVMVFIEGIGGNIKTVVRIHKGEDEA